MFHFRFICGLFGVMMFTTLEVSTERTHKKIYIDLDGTSPCFRRMNGTHQVGCASHFGGNVGVVHYVQGEDDIAWIKNHGTHAPYTVLLTSSLFNKKIIDALIGTKKVNSVLVIYANDTKSSMSFSADSTCPNDRSGIYHGDADYGDCKKWNPPGTNFMFRDFPFPILALSNETEINTLITQCYEQFNKPGSDGKPRLYPLCSAEVKDEMNAVVDTPTCIRRSKMFQGMSMEKYCDPLGDYNVHATTRPITFNNHTGNDSIIVAAARLDGFSMFENLNYNSEGTVSGIVTLLAAAYVIGKTSLPENHKPIMFTFFQGEAFDYIGSSRVVYDMQKGVFPTLNKKKGNDDSVCPITLSQLHSFLEVSQVAIPEGDKIWLHRDPLSSKTTGKRVTEMADLLTAAGIEVGLNIALVSGVNDQPLPSASLQSFLRETKLAGIVVADHKDAYRNKYYNSRFDLPETINASYPPDMQKNMTYNYVTAAAVHLAKVSSAIAKTLYTLSTGQAAPAQVMVDNITMANLLNCFLFDGTCDLFSKVSRPHANLLKKPYTYYVGVMLEEPGHITTLTHNILAYYLGEKLNISSDNCTQWARTDLTQGYTYMAGPKDSTGVRQGICVRSTANISKALSPAFDIIGYDWTSGRYSSWTESHWGTDAIKLRIFLVPSHGREIMTLCVGMGLFAFSLALIFWIHKRVPVMFRPLRTSL